MVEKICTLGRCFLIAAWWTSTQGRFGRNSPNFQYRKYCEFYQVQLSDDYGSLVWGTPIFICRCMLVFFCVTLFIQVYMILEFWDNKETFFPKHHWNSFIVNSVHGIPAFLVLLYLFYIIAHNHSLWFSFSRFHPHAAASLFFTVFPSLIFKLLLLCGMLNICIIFIQSFIPPPNQLTFIKSPKCLAFF